MERQAVWDVIVEERLALLSHLRELSDEEWDRPSLCDAWRVRDVAAHVISAPQMRWAATLKVMPRMWRGYNRAILRDGQRRGALPVEEILAQYDRWAAVRRGPVSVTHVEPLVDVLVHTQDILRPLGRRHRPPAEAAAVAADRVRLLAPLFGTTATVRRLRLRATDTEWERGRGPLVEGPAMELLLLCAGRRPDRELLAGDGVDRVVGAATPSTRRAG
ncbi:MAG TPA: maleylpyruvate isomerase family mycothiol-dependent enzyme [Nocardioides sp.]|nr:maleylpyruvate isomerase family mycothiol-dependent enzyme [Nocardioides sp.]